MAKITYLDQEQAQQLDVELMGPLGFSVDQLMELAGLSVACSVASEYSLGTHKRILVVAGPGNNGGDGLVAARHLHHFGYSVQVCYPKPTDKALYNGLVTQLRSLEIPFVEVNQLAGVPLVSQFEVVLDAMFGFSFKGSPRPPFDQLVKMLSPAASPPPVVSVDIPSGWHVEAGDEGGQGLRPDMLVSLTAPKLCAKQFAGRYHYLGGRFVPPAIRHRFRLQLPAYPGTSQCVRIGGSGEGAAGRVPPEGGDVRVADMRISYEHGGLLEDQVVPDPLDQFDSWFREATACGIREPNAMALASCNPATGSPSVRYVLLKGYDKRGFVFYTNYTSRKGEELGESGRAALAFWWEPLQRQVRVEGSVERVPNFESDDYFNSRPRGSRVGAHVSEQSSVLAGGRQELDAKAQLMEEQYADERVPVPRPAHWGGYLVRPESVEFWQGRPSRLHDRLRYRRRDGVEGWIMERLAP